MNDLQLSPQDKFFCQDSIASHLDKKNEDKKAETNQAEMNEIQPKLNDFIVENVGTKESKKDQDIDFTFRAQKIIKKMQTQEQKLICPQTTKKLVKDIKNRFKNLAQAYNLFDDPQNEATFLNSFESCVRQATLQVINAEGTFSKSFNTRRKSQGLMANQQVKSPILFSRLLDRAKSHQESSQKIIKKKANDSSKSNFQSSYCHHDKPNIEICQLVLSQQSNQTISRNSLSSESCMSPQNFTISRQWYNNKSMTSDKKKNLSKNREQNDTHHSKRSKSKKSKTSSNMQIQFNPEDVLSHQEFILYDFMNQVNETSTLKHKKFKRLKPYDTSETYFQDQDPIVDDKQRNDKQISQQQACTNNDKQIRSSNDDFPIDLSQNSILRSNQDKIMLHHITSKEEEIQAHDWMLNNIEEIDVSQNTQLVEQYVSGFAKIYSGSMNLKNTQTIYETSVRQKMKKTLLKSATFSIKQSPKSIIMQPAVYQPPKETELPGTIYEIEQFSLIGCKDQKNLETMLLNQWLQSKQREKKTIMMRQQHAQFTQKVPTQCQSPLLPEHQSSLLLQAPRKSEVVGKVDAEPINAQFEQWFLSNSLLNDTPNQFWAKGLLDKLNFEYSDAQFKLMEHMLLQPIIDRKYLLKLKHEDSLQNIAHAIMPQVIQKMENFDLIEYEMKDKYIINKELQDLSQFVNKFMQGKLINVPQDYYSGLQELYAKWTPIQLFQSDKFLSLKMIIRVLEQSEMKQKNQQAPTKFQSFNKIIAQLQPKFFQKLSEKQTIKSYKKAKAHVRSVTLANIQSRKQTMKIIQNQLNQAESNKLVGKTLSLPRILLDQAKQQITRRMTRGSKKTHHLFKEDTKLRNSDFSNFVTLKSCAEKMPYILDMQTYQKMKQLVKTQPLNYYLGNKRSWLKSLACRLRDINMLPIMEQALETTRLNAMSAAFNLQRERMRQLETEAYDSSSSCEDEFQIYKRMDALLPDPTQVIKDVMNNERSLGMVPAPESVNPELRSAQHQFQIFPQRVLQWHMKHKGKTQRQKLLIEYFCMETKLQKVPNFEPFMDIFVPQSITSRTAIRRMNAFNQEQPKKNQAQANKPIQMHKIRYNATKGTLILSKQKLNRANSEQNRSNSQCTQEKSLSKRSSSMNSHIELHGDNRNRDQNEECSIMTDDSLEQLGINDIYDFYQMLDDQSIKNRNTNVRQFNQKQNDRFDILLQGFKTVTMDYVNKDVLDKDDKSVVDNDGNEIDKTKKKKQIDITDQTISDEFKIHDILEEMVAKFSKNRVMEFVHQHESDARKQDKEDIIVREYTMERKRSSCSITSESKLTRNSKKKWYPKNQFLIFKQKTLRKNIEALNAPLEVPPIKIELDEDVNLDKDINKDLDVNQKIVDSNQMLQLSLVRRPSSLNAIRKNSINDIEDILDDNEKLNIVSMIDKTPNNKKTQDFSMQFSSLGRKELQRRQKSANNSQIANQEWNSSLASGSSKDKEDKQKNGLDSDFESESLPSSKYSYLIGSSQAGSSKFKLEEHRSQSSEDNEPICDQIQKRLLLERMADQQQLVVDLEKTNQEEVKQNQGQIERILTKKLKRQVRILRQDVFKPDIIPDDTKKVVCLARKTSKMSIKVLEAYKKVQNQMPNNLLTKQQSSKQQQQKLPDQLKKPGQTHKNTKRIEQSRIYDQQQLKRLILRGGSFEMIVEAIKKYPESLNMPIDNNRMSWLMLAVKTGRSDVAKFLISQRVDLNQVDIDGNTALHHAFMLNFQNCIQVLVDGGTDEDIKNKQGASPWELINE